MNNGKIYYLLKRFFCVCNVLSFSIFFIFLYGCSDKVTLPNEQELAEFNNAGPLTPVLDMDQLVQAKIGGGPYRLVSGEVIELTMPAILQAVTSAETGINETNVPFVCRINENGDIVLPVIGEIKAAGKTLAQIESEITSAYYPKYITTQPSVFAKVLEYKTYKVTISGAVNTPGIYSLRRDQMSIVGLLMEADGIIDQGAASITINHQKTDMSQDIINENNINNDSDTLQVKRNQKITMLTGRNKTRDFRFSLFRPPSSDFDVQINFSQSSIYNTNGILTVSHNDEVVLTKQFDITSETDRLTFLKQLSIREPRISIGDIEQKLCELADILLPKSRKLTNNNIAYLSTFNELENANDKKLFNLAFNEDYVNTGLPGYGSQKELFTKTIFLKTGMENDEKEDLDQITHSASIVLPIKGYNIPFADLALQDGDSVIVERLEQPLFSVVGLVLRPGNFPYPLGSTYNLMQALAFAGGLDPATEPRYATIYRLKADGQVVHATFEIVNAKDSSELTNSLNVSVKPGDIVSVEHTPRTRTKQFIDSVFRLNIGTYYNLNDAWND